MQQVTIAANSTYKLLASHRQPDEEKALLLKFWTSCSRPPLQGFKHLHPALCIQKITCDDDRLPTASTCMNLLLPFYSNAEVMKKLLLSIHSAKDGGFGLSHNAGGVCAC